MAGLPDKKIPPANTAQSKQYDLFVSFFGDPKDLSNSIELWDAIPRYCVSARRQNAMRDERGHLRIHTHEFEYDARNLDRAVKCEMKVKPARIEMPDGTEKEFFPSQNEELIEEVLKKIFSDQQYGLHSPKNEESWVRFTLHMIRKELRSRGHTRSLNEIKRSLEIMESCHISLKMDGQRSLTYSNPILTNVTRTTRADIEDDPGAKWVAQLPSLISRGINTMGYRQFNYALQMRLSTPLARFLHTRLVNRYRQASLTTPYKFLFSSISRDSGLLWHSRMSANVESLDEALEELKSQGILLLVKSEKRFKGRKLEDVLYEVTASSEFTKEVKAASARLNEGTKQLNLGGR